MTPSTDSAAALPATATAPPAATGFPVARTAGPALPDETFSAPTVAVEDKVVVLAPESLAALNTTLSPAAASSASRANHGRCSGTGRGERACRATALDARALPRHLSQWHRRPDPLAEYDADYEIDSTWLPQSAIPARGHQEYLGKLIPLWRGPRRMTASATCAGGGGRSRANAGSSRPARSFGAADATRHCATETKPWSYSKSSGAACTSPSTS